MIAPNNGQALNWKPHSDGVLGGLKMPKGRGEGWPSENKLMRVRFILGQFLVGVDPPSLIPVDNDRFFTVFFIGDLP